MRLRWIAALLACQAGLGCGGGDPRAQLAQATAVTLGIDLEDPPREMRISDPDQVARFLDFGELASKAPCRCAHFEYVVFHAPEADVRVSICDHCFDVWQGDDVACYEMPPGFYERFRETIGPLPDGL